MKLSLNGQALTKLIELCGGEEFVLELQRGVMENVMKSRVKALHSDLMEVAMDAQISAELKRLVGEVTGGYYNKVVTIQPEILQKIQAVANEAVRVRLAETLNNLDDTINSAITDRIGKEFEKTIDNRIDLRVTAEINKIVDAKVRERVKFMITAAGFSTT